MTGRRRSNGEGTCYKVGPGKWQGQVWVTSGRRRRVKVSGTTKAEVLARLRDMKAKDAAGIQVAGRTPTVAELLDDWLTDVMPGRVVASTISSYRWVTDKHLVPRIGTKRVASLSVADVETMLRRMASDGLSRSSCFRARAVLGQALTWAERRDLIQRNVARLAELPADATPVREGRALNSNEAHALLEAARTITVKVPRTDRTETRPRRTEALWVLQLVLGLRPGEVAGLLWDDVDFETELVHVRRSMKYTDGNPVELGEVKTGSRGRGRRTLELPPMALDALRRHRTAQTAERLAIGRYWPDEWDGLVFRTEAGTPYSASNLRRDLAQIQKAAGIEGRLTRYDLRHSAATIMAASGVRLEDIADQLGHEDVTMARGIYTHATREPLRTAAAIMQDALGA